MRYSIDLHLTKDDVIEEGHRPGIIRFAGATVYFGAALYEETCKDVTQMQRLREIVQAHIDAILAEKIQVGQESLPANAPAEELAAPWIPPSPILGGVFDHKEGCRAPDYGPCTCGLTGIAIAAPPLEGQPVESPSPDAAYTCQDCGTISVPLSEHTCPYSVGVDLAEKVEVTSADVVAAREGLEEDVPF